MKPEEVPTEVVTRGLAVRPPSGVSAPLNPEALIAQAIERGVDVGVMERLLDMRTKLRQENAKAEFDQAMAAFQSECPIITKTKAGAKGMYKFAPLDHIVEQVRGLIQKHGFSFKLNSEIDKGWVKAICTVTHLAGHSETTEFKCPIDDNRANAMTEPQRYGAAMTFSKRYSFCNAFGILTSDEDTDGGQRPKPQGPSSLAADDAEVDKCRREAWGLLKKVRGTESNWNAANQYLWKQDLLDAAADERCPNLSAARFKTLIAALKGREDLR